MKLEEEKTKLKMLKAQMDVNMAAGRVRTYNQIGSNAGGAHNIPPPSVKPTPNVNGHCGTAVTASKLQESSQSSEVNLAESIVCSLTWNLLPFPEPTMFAGDPLKFVDFKVSFTTLIDRRPLPASEKMLYLKSYLTGEARRAIEGFFYRSSEDAYEGAWSVLKDRYGSPFVVQKAFQDKLMMWPKIGPNDSLALWDFADFRKRLCRVHAPC